MTSSYLTLQKRKQMAQIKQSSNISEMLKLSDEERIAFISKERWINYPAAEDILKKLDYIRVYEKGKTRVTSILLYGSSNNGKTTILEKYIENNPPYDLYGSNPHKDTQKHYDKHHIFGIPALYIIAPNEASESRLFSQILNSVNAVFKDKDTIARKQYLVEYYMEVLNVEMIIIDEIQGILNGSPTKQRQVMTAIKNLSNAIKIPIVLSGTKDALRAISIDSQTKKRFKPIHLNKWTFNEDLISLVATLISTMPLKKESDILNTKAVQEILKITDGYIGDIVGLLTAASIYAINTKSEKVTLKEIKECGYESMDKLEKEMLLNNI